MNRFTKLAYEALVTEIVNRRLAQGLFTSGISWYGEFAELPPEVRAPLNEVNESILNFCPTARNLPSNERQQSLLHVFFDCYFGYLRRPAAPSRNAYEELVRTRWQMRFRRYKTYLPTKKKILCTYSGGVDISMRVTTNWVTAVIEKIRRTENKNRPTIDYELGQFLQGKNQPLQPLASSAITEQRMAADKLAADAQRILLSQTLDRDDALNLAEKIRGLLQADITPRQIGTLTSLLQATLGSIQITSAGINWGLKMDIRTQSDDARWDITDSLAEIGRTVGSRRALGGAAATGADALTVLGEPHVYLLLPYLPDSLRSLFDSPVKILWYDQNKQLQTYSRDNWPEVEGKHPEVRNFVLEFSADSPVVYCDGCNAAIQPGRTDRLIIRNSFAFYQPDNSSVDRTRTSIFSDQLRKVNGLCGFDVAINPNLKAYQEALAKQVTDGKYDILFATGLQSLNRTVQEIAESDLNGFFSKGSKIHVEVAGLNNLEWLSEMIRRYVCSVSLGEDELSSLLDAVRRTSPSSGSANPPQFPASSQKVIQALEITVGLGVKRLYIHGIDVDIIIYKGNLPKEQRLQEIQADLVAKWTVLRKLMSRGVIMPTPISSFRDTMTQVSEAGFAVLREMSQALDAQWPPQSDGDTELYGTYIDQYDCTVILVPIRWVYGAMQDQLRIVGAGDTTSLVSVAQSTVM